MNFFRTPVKFIALYLAFLCSNTVWASQAEPLPDQKVAAQTSYDELDDKALAEIFQAYMQDESVKICEVKSLLSEMSEREVFATDLAPIHTIASTECFVERKDWKKAYEQIQKWESFEGAEPPAAEWAFRLAYLAGARDDMLERFEKMAQFDEPDQLLMLSDQAIFQMVRDLRRDQALTAVTRFYNALVQSPHFGKLQSNIRSAAAVHILGERLKSGKRDGAKTLLAHITSPFFYNEMLATRKYQLIWNEIELGVGENMKTMLEENLRIQGAAHQTNPDDKQVKQLYGHALLFSGQFEDVIALAQSIDHSAESALNWEEDDGWLLNLEAHAHDALGNTAKADQIFDSFVILDDSANQRSWLVNFLINRALRLVEQKRWEEGLAATETAEKMANETGNPYSRMLVRKAKACSLHNLERRKEARTVIKEVEKNLTDSLPVAVETFLCVGDRERAAEIMVDGLSIQKERPALIEALQKPFFDLFYSASLLPNVHGELLSHPDVARAFDQIARSIPDRYIPVGSQRRQELIAERSVN